MFVIETRFMIDLRKCKYFLLIPKDSTCIYLMPIMITSDLLVVATFYYLDKDNMLK